MGGGGTIAASSEFKIRHLARETRVTRLRSSLCHLSPASSRPSGRSWKSLEGWSASNNVLFAISIFVIVVSVPPWVHQFTQT